MGKILIVDDSVVMRNNLSYMLTAGGHEIIGQAANGKQALELYDQLKPDLVTMDISMPIMTGVEAVKHIINKDSKAKIVMISALNQKQMVFDALNYGAKHYIIKPIESNKLLGIVNEVLDSKEEESIKENEQDLGITEPGFRIENSEGKFIIYFNENLGVKDYEALDTAIKGLLFIKPLKIVFDFGILEHLSSEILITIVNLANKIKDSAGSVEYSGKSEKLISKVKTGKVIC